MFCCTIPTSPTDQFGLYLKVANSGQNYKGLVAFKSHYSISGFNSYFPRNLNCDGEVSTNLKTLGNIV